MPGAPGAVVAGALLARRVNAPLGRALLRGVVLAFLNPPLVAVLLARGARVDEGRPRPLMLAAAEADQVEMVTLLLNAGADPTARDVAGRTAVEVARPSSEVSAILDRALTRPKTSR